MPKVPLVQPNIGITLSCSQNYHQLLAKFNFEQLRYENTNSTTCFEQVKIGAGGKCWSSRVCPDFVLCVDIVHNISSLCLEYVLAQCMTSICVHYQTYFLAKSNICPSDPTFVISLSPWATKIDKNFARQNLVILWHYFLHLYHLVTLQV